MARHQHQVDMPEHRSIAVRFGNGEKIAVSRTGQKGLTLVSPSRISAKFPVPPLF
jgi:hypothetical protein